MKHEEIEKIIQDLLAVIKKQEDQSVKVYGFSFLLLPLYYLFFKRMIGVHWFMAGVSTLGCWFLTLIAYEMVRGSPPVLKESVFQFNKQFPKGSTTREQAIDLLDSYYEDDANEMRQEAMLLMVEIGDFALPTPKGDSHFNETKSTSSNTSYREESIIPSSKNSFIRLDPEDEET